MSYCIHPGGGVYVLSLYLLHMLMDQDDNLHSIRYYSEVLCYTTVTHLGDLQAKVTFYVKVFKTLKYVNGSS